MYLDAYILSPIKKWNSLWAIHWNFLSEGVINYKWLRNGIDLCSFNCSLKVNNVSQNKNIMTTIYTLRKKNYESAQEFTSLRLIVTSTSLRLLGLFIFLYSFRCLFLIFRQGKAMHCYWDEWMLKESCSLQVKCVTLQIANGFSCSF